MKKRLDACLLLGCNGYMISSTFKNCGGVENIIVELSNLNDDLYSTTVEFFDTACDLFSTVITDYNKCINIITLLHREYHIVDSNNLTFIQKFLKTHKDCGIYLTLVNREDV